MNIEEHVGCKTGNIIKKEISNIIWKEVADVSGISGYGYNCNKDPLYEPKIEELKYFQTNININSFLKEGTNYFHINAFDNAGNISETIHKRILIDNSPPVIISIISPE